jgi:hypothetical protein
LHENPELSLVTGIVNTITNITLCEDVKIRRQVVKIIGLDRILPFLKTDSEENIELQKAIILLIGNLATLGKR